MSTTTSTFNPLDCCRKEEKRFNKCLKKHVMKGQVMSVQEACEEKLQKFQTCVAEAVERHEAGLQGSGGTGSD